MWVAWPREGTSVNIHVNFGKIALSSGDLNWYMRWEN